MRNVYLFYCWQFPQLLERDVIFGAVELDQVGEVFEMVLVDVDDASIRDIGGYDFFRVLEMQHLEQHQAVY